MKKKSRGVRFGGGGQSVYERRIEVFVKMQKKIRGGGGGGGLVGSGKGGGLVIFVMPYAKPITCYCFGKLPDRFVTF